MDTIVQLIRNALCCIKDLGLFEGTFIHEAKYTHRLADLPSPLDETTPLEVLISITQLYACVSTARSGFNLLTSSVGKLRRILRIVEYRMTATSSNQKTKQPSTEADRIVNESLLKEAKFAFRSVIIGILVTPIGVCFWWLFINSWHVTSVDWFGGLPALIHALEVMELCLLPLLYLMIKDGFEMLAKSKRTGGVLENLKNGKITAASGIGIQSYETMTGWVPFWDAGTTMFADPVEGEMALVEKEVKSVEENLSAWFETKKGEKEEKINRQALADAEEKLETAVPVLRFEGYREFIYFVLNFVAFYGYLMAPLTFYWDDDETQPYHIQSMMFGYRNVDADWTGNFAGDLMWTVEPLIVLGSPFLVAMLKPQKKVKAD
eukprot:CAMPEP_0117005968 /NCGR_PEP_ID=MMETSP0472-20121206/6365_1 /TAXON_ID=693140 ORGANISM="Tiarina fusus, Strain LIS" /NCGR_SAMPLE_ID=MMETSP0472 /ASSEMBLY_ACC=CAM_ASM_000603 /LENGTH=377 /DNA_ID=CAMNT_0004707301 /DNA_START=111 /DNA_END=1244 /DNA_ORIENTATION=-